MHVGLFGTLLNHEFHILISLLIFIDKNVIQHPKPHKQVHEIISVIKSTQFETKKKNALIISNLKKKKKKKKIYTPISKRPFHI